MNRRLIVLLVALAATAGCSTIADSRLNPFNWFGRSREVATSATVEPADPRPLMAQVTRLAIEQTPGGAIVRATGLPPSQGYFDGELVPVSDGVAVDGILEYEFRAFPPPAPTRASTPQSREIVVGLFLTDQEMAGVRQIRVDAAENARAASR